MCENSWKPNDSLLHSAKLRRKRNLGNVASMKYASARRMSDSRTRNRCNNLLDNLTISANVSVVVVGADSATARDHAHLLQAEEEVAAAAVVVEGARGNVSVEDAEGFRQGVKGCRIRTFHLADEAVVAAVEVTAAIEIEIGTGIGTDERGGLDLGVLVTADLGARLSLVDTGAQRPITAAAAGRDHQTIVQEEAVVGEKSKVPAAVEAEVDVGLPVRVPTRLAPATAMDRIQTGVEVDTNVAAAAAVVGKQETTGKTRWKGLSVKTAIRRLRTEVPRGKKGRGLPRSEKNTVRGRKAPLGNVIETAIATESGIEIETAIGTAIGIVIVTAIAIVRERKRGIARRTARRIDHVTVIAIVTVAATMNPRVSATDLSPTPNAPHPPAKTASPVVTMKMWKCTMQTTAIAKTLLPKTTRKEETKKRKEL